MKNINHHAEQNLRNRLEEHEFDFDPKAWSAMNKTLNRHNPRRSPLWVSSLIILTALVTLSSIAWYVPFDPIQELLEKTFDFKEKVIEEQPIQNTQVWQGDAEIIDFQKTTIPNYNNTPTEKEMRDAPILPLPQIKSFDLLDFQKEQSKEDLETAKPITPIATYLENIDETITPVELPIKRKINAGFFGGGSVAISGSPLIPEGAVSPGIGVFAGYNINDKWSVQMEVNFRKGFVQPFTAEEDRSETLNIPEINAASPSYDRVVANEGIIAKNLTVLEFPVLAKYKVNKKHSVMAGVRPSWIHVKDPNSDNSTTDNHHAAIYDKVDVGLSVGYEMQLTDRVALNLRYNKGVTDLFEENEDSYYNNDFQASIRYMLNP